MTAEIDRRVEELASKQLGLFAVRQVLLQDGTNEMIDHRRAVGRWESRGRGVLGLLGTPDSFERRVMAEILRAPCDPFASHRCAIRLHGFAGYREMIELTSRRGSRLRLPAVVCHTSTELPRHHVVCVDGVPTTSLARTLFDLTSVVRPLRVARTLDTALARQQLTLVARSRVARDLRARGRRKASVVRAILKERGEDFVAPASELEHEFVTLIERSDLPRPRRQVDLGSELSWIGRVDFAYPCERIVVETDGKETHTSLLDRRADAARDAALTTAGWTVLRFSWFDIVHDGTRTLETLGRALQLSGAS
jgi:very-short-patch-repair endonuclease